MKRRFMKCIGIMIMMCISIVASKSVLADETYGEIGWPGSSSINVSVDPSDYAVANTESGTTVNHSGAINTDGRGILADNGSSVNQTGSVISGDEAVVSVNNSSVYVGGDVNVNGFSYSEENYHSAMYAYNNSQVIVDGHVTSDCMGVRSKDSAITISNGIDVHCTEKCDSQSSIGYLSVHDSSNNTLNVTGDINASTNNSDDAGANGIRILTFTPGTNDVSVNGNVNANVEGKSRALSTGMVIGDENGKESNVKIHGDISATAHGYGPEGNISTIGYEDVSALGIAAYGGRGNVTEITVDGNVSTKASSTSTSNEVINIDSRGIVASEGTGSMSIAVNGSISAELASEVNSVYGNSVIGISVGAVDESGHVNIKVDRDVSSSGNGLAVHSNDGEVNIIIGGTLYGKEVAVSSVSLKEYNRQDGSSIETHGVDGKLDLTVWQIKSDSNELVKVYHTDSTVSDENKRRIELKDKEEEILKNINYIIRTDNADNGIITLSGTSVVSGYNTAHESQEVIIRVETASGYMLDAVKNGDSTLKKNADGTYSLIVPRGGGVQLRAVISAIKQMNGGGSSGGSGGSGGSGNGGISYGQQAVDNNGTTTQSLSGATVTTVSSDDNGVKSSTATISIEGKTATVETTITVENGKETSLRYSNGDISGVTFNGVGTVSADGTTVTTLDGQVYSLTSAPMLLVTENGRTKGCFYNQETNSPISTGDMSIIYQLGADGQLHAHWVGSNGYFYTGLVYMEGHFFTFDNEGIMIGVEW